MEKFGLFADSYNESLTYLLITYDLCLAPLGFEKKNGTQEVGNPPF